MSESEVKQGKRGGKRRPQIFTKRAVARAGRACPNRIVRILRDGVIELVPMTSEGGEREQQKNDWDEVLKNAPD